MKARYVKLHCRYDERDADGSVHDISTFRNAARSIVTVGYHETSRRESYDYDDQGNRLYVETRLGSRTDSFAYSYYAGSDRVRTSGDRAYVYDKNGNMTERGTSYAFDGDDPIYEHDDYYRAYEYDPQNRLVKVSGYEGDSLTVLATYTYAGDNLRLTKTAGGVATSYVHGVDGNELYRVTASASVSTVWLFGRKLVEIEQASGTEERTYLHTDHLGSVVAATDETGETIWLGDNSAFGVATADVGYESRTASYTGKDYDEEAGLYYFNARWYDAELGKFTTEDPARDDVNWYVYCANRPMTHTDPTGEDIKDVNNTLTQQSSSSKLGTSQVTIADAGCVLTAYTRIAMALSGRNISLEEANTMAVALNLFSNRNELSPDAGASLINALVDDPTKTIFFSGSISGTDAEIGSKLNQLEDNQTSYFITGRLETTNADGTKSYEHTININNDAVSAGNIQDMDDALKIALNDTSNAGRVSTQGDVRKNDLLRIDVFYVKNMRGIIE